MTNFNEIDLQNALTRYAVDNGADLSVNNCWVLPSGERSGYENLDNVQWTHESIPEPTEQQLIIVYDNWLAEYQQEMAVVEQVKAVEEGAKTKASAIPNWASWTEVEALNWHDTNIQNALPVANLTEANTVIQKLETENRALLRMVLALRNKVFPDLEGN